MTSEFVLDASVGVAWVAASQATQETVSLMDAVIGGTPIVVPMLWMSEVANVLLVLSQRGRLTRREWIEGRELIGQISVVLDEEGAMCALGRVSDLAAKHSLTVYDATYLELAQRRSLPLATRDIALNRAAQKCGVKTLL